MKKLLALVGEQAVDVVLIEHPDRLVRFGCSYLAQAFQWQHVWLEVLEQPQAQEPPEELLRDMLTIVTVFAGRLHGQRAKGLRSRVQSALKECEQEAEGRDGTGQADHLTAP
jgi:predicted site-specific integrase-resolvase